MGGNFYCGGGGGVLVRPKIKEYLMFLYIDCIADTILFFILNAEQSCQCYFFH